MMIPLLLLGCVGATDSADAQEPPSNQARAQALFEQGLEALDTGRFARARDLLEDAVILYPTASLAFNLAIALRGTGQTVEAASTIEALLEGRFGPLTEERRQEAESLLSAVSSEVGTLRLSTRPRAAVLVDGVERGHVNDTGELTIAVSAGERVISARLSSGETGQAQVSVEGGDTVDVSIALRSPLDEAPLPSSGDDDSIVESPWFWVVSGALVVASVVVLAVLLASPGEDAVFGRAEALAP